MLKSKHQVPGRVRSVYEFIKTHREQYSVQMMCRVLEVAQSGYYDWLKQPVSNRAQEDARLLRLIRASFIASHGIYGAPRDFLDLREAGETCSKHRVARPPTPAAATAAASACGNGNSSNSRIARASPSPSVISHRGPANGTGLSTGCFRTSP